jgi:RNA ligase (TIGR02306 family)
MNEQPGLVYVGKIVQIDPIPDADLIVSATVICGKGGKWRGIVRKSDFSLGDKCLVYLPDALIPENEEMRFMASSGWRVKMRKFRGAPSEVVIMPIPIALPMNYEIGDNLTEWCGVTKYCKPVPAHLQGIAKGQFPSFIPKTDELNYQRHFDLVESLHGKPYYITEKADGSSTTAFRYKGEFGICSRNLELLPDENNGYWKVAAKYQLTEKLPDNYAIQWETCGPKIQNNPMGLKEIDGFMFSAYKIDEHRYLDMIELWTLSDYLGFPMVKVLEYGMSFDKEKIHLLGEGKYDNGKEREGVVIRSQENFYNAPISFKVINLNYEK